MDVKIEASWKKALEAEFAMPYFATLVEQLKMERQSGKKIFPAGSQIFRAFDTTPFDKVKLVILGQDPYHGPGQANGLCFSVNSGVPLPPSLQNIFKEIQQDTGVKMNFSNGDLQCWANQGVLLLNASLTVREAEAGSHANIGWLPFTDAAIRALSNHRNNIIFMLWGNFAQQKQSLIDTSRHHILTSAHPSPLAAHRGFFGCKHFSKANELLSSHGLSTINWSNQ